MKYNAINCFVHISFAGVGRLIKGREDVGGRNWIDEGVEADIV